jgi:curved DNA-binding protein CbpA
MNRAEAAHDSGDDERALKLVLKSLRLCETERSRSFKDHLEKFGDGTVAAKAVKRVIDLPANCSLYNVLNVRPSASQADIKRAYKTLSLELHPDRNRARNAEEAFKRVNGAFKILSNPNDRADHDRRMDGWSSGSSGFGGGHRAGSNGSSSSSSNPYAQQEAARRAQEHARRQAEFEAQKRRYEQQQKAKEQEAERASQQAARERTYAQQRQQQQQQQSKPQAEQKKPRYPHDWRYQQAQANAKEYQQREAKPSSAPPSSPPPQSGTSSSSQGSKGGGGGGGGSGGADSSRFHGAADMEKLAEEAAKLFQELGAKLKLLPSSFISRAENHLESLRKVLGSIRAAEASMRGKHAVVARELEYLKEKFKERREEVVLARSEGAREAAAKIRELRQANEALASERTEEVDSHKDHMEQLTEQLRKSREEHHKDQQALAAARAEAQALRASLSKALARAAEAQVDIGDISLDQLRGTGGRGGGAGGEGGAEGFGEQARSAGDAPPRHHHQQYLGGDEDDEDDEDDGPVILDDAAPWEAPKAEEKASDAVADAEVDEKAERRAADVAALRRKVLERVAGAEITPEVARTIAPEAGAVITDEKEPPPPSSSTGDLETAEQFKRSFSELRLGLTLESRVGHITIKRCNPGSAAERAGVPWGVRVLAIDDHELGNCSLKDVQSLLQAAPRPVTITFAQTEASRHDVSQALDADRGGSSSTGERAIESPQ